MGHVDLAHVSYFLPDGRALLYEVSFRVGDGAKTALLGANGTGKTTLLRMIAGDLEPAEGTIVRSGGLGVMRQFIGSVRDATTVRGFLAAMAPAAIRGAAQRLEAAETAAASGDERAQLAYAQAIADWTDVGGWDAEVLWETCIRESLGLTLADAGHRPVSTLSGGEQKRLALEALLRGPDEVLLLDEPDNYLDVPAKRWLEERLQKTPKTVLYVSHDRELIAETAAADRHGRGAHGVDARRPLRDATTRRAPTGSRGSRSCGGAGTRSTSGSRSWCARCASRRRSRPTWRAATGRCARASRSSRRPGRRPRSRVTRPSRCG